jgi:hypothetical protein
MGYYIILREYYLVLNTNNEIYLGGSVFIIQDNLPTFWAYKASNPDFSTDGLILNLMLMDNKFGEHFMEE